MGAPDQDAARGTLALSCIVCVRNGARPLERFLPRLAATLDRSPDPAELIVVDDASTDESGDVARRAAPGARVLRLSRHSGSAAARNHGASAALAEWLLFCDDDVVISPTTLDQLLHDRRVGVCLVPPVVRSDGWLENAVAARWQRGQLKFDTAPAPISPVAYPVGSCFLIARDLYHRVGGMDTRFFPNYFEDTAFGVALWRAGARIEMVDAPPVTHHRHGGAGSEKDALAIAEAVEKHNVLFHATSLRGRRRVVAISVGAVGAVARSVRLTSTRPLAVYLSGLSRIRRTAGPQSSAAVRNDADLLALMASGQPLPLTAYHGSSA